MRPEKMRDGALRSCQQQRGAKLKDGQLPDPECQKGLRCEGAEAGHRHADARCDRERSGGKLEVGPVGYAVEICQIVKRIVKQTCGDVQAT
jgi:hypothetical protein